MGLRDKRVLSLAFCAVATLGLAGCGGSSKQSATGSSQSSTAIPQVRPLSSGSRKPASRGFLLEVNDVCRTVRQGAPRPLRAPYTRAGVSRYATAAQAPTRRTIVSLQRLAALGDGQALRVLGAGYVQLRAAFAAAGLLAHDPRAAGQLGATIQLREQAVTAASRTYGVPACGVAGR